MSRLVSGSIAVLVLSALSGCATITRGTTEVLVIETDPVGASVSVSPVNVTCTSPCNLKLKRKGDYTIDVTKEGYEAVRVNVLSQIAGAGAAGMAGNVLVGGLIGVGVDAASGATKELKPNPLKINMARSVAASAPTPVQPIAAAEADLLAPPVASTGAP